MIFRHLSTCLIVSYFRFKYMHYGATFYPASPSFGA